MATKKKNLILMKSTESGFAYVTKISARKKSKDKPKLVLKKYDPTLRKHVEFKQKSAK